MENEYQIITELYPILKQLLIDGFHLDSHLFLYPYENIESVDKGLRKAIFKDYAADASTFSTRGIRLDVCNVILVQSTLKFYNIVATFPHGSNPDLLTAGPFRNEEVNHAFLEGIIQTNKLSESQTAFLRDFYQSMPLLDPDETAVTLLHFLQGFIPDFKSVEIIKINYSEIRRRVQIEGFQIDAYSTDYIKAFDDHLKETLNAVKTGITADATQTAAQFINHLGVNQIFVVSVLKRFNHMLNYLLYHSVTEAFVHPGYAMRQMVSFCFAIDGTKDCRALQRMPFDIVHKYTILVKNYSHPEYSRMVREIVQYIDLHLDEDLSLDFFSSYLHKNQTYISATFKAEVGIGLSNYISSERIHAAMRLLNTTDMTIADIATAVGFQDFGYFTKVFKKQVNKTPSEYKKMMK